MKIGRNQECPCGSGDKYKRCCLTAHREFERLEQERIDALYAAVDWLEEHHQEEVQTAFLNDFLDVLEDDELARFEKLPGDLREAWLNNAYDWLIAEGELETDENGATEEVLPILLNQLSLSDSQRGWMERIGETPIALYRVEEVLPCKGFVARRLSDDALVEVDQQTSFDAYEQGDLLGLRLVPGEGEKYWLTSAVYAFDDAEEESILEELGRIDAPDDEDRPWIVGNALIDLWIQALAAEA